MSLIARRLRDSEGARIPQKNDRLYDKHVEWTSKVTLDQLFQIDFHFFLFRVYGPILRPPAQLGCLPYQDNRWIRLVYEQVVQNRYSCGQGSRNILRPAPAEMTSYDGASDKRRE